MSFGLSFLVSILRNHRMHGTHAARFIQTWRRKSIRWVPGTGIWSIWSTEVNNWCVLEISQFYLCFVTLIEHFYMPPLFFFDVYALSKLRSIISYFMTPVKKKLTGVRIFPGYTTRFLSRLLLCWLYGSHLEKSFYASLVRFVVMTKEMKAPPKKVGSAQSNVYTGSGRGSVWSGIRQKSSAWFGNTEKTQPWFVNSILAVTRDFLFL